jgi:hypothetical protein
MPNEIHRSSLIKHRICHITWSGVKVRSWKKQQNKHRQLMQSEGLVPTHLFNTLSRSSTGFCFIYSSRYSVILFGCQMSSNAVPLPTRYTRNLRRQCPKQDSNQESWCSSSGIHCDRRDFIIMIAHSHTSLALQRHAFRNFAPKNFRNERQHAPSASLVTRKRRRSSEVFRIKPNTFLRKRKKQSIKLCFRARLVKDFSAF